MRIPYPERDKWPLRSVGTLLAELCILFVLAALTTLLAHLAIDVLSAGLAGHADAYEGYQHIALGPLAVAAGAAAVAWCGRTLVMTLARAEACDPLDFASRLTLAQVGWRMVSTVFVLALLLLFGIEFSEQVAAFGHRESWQDALGGNPLLGLGIIAACALFVAGLARLGASTMLRLVAVSCLAIVGFFLRWDAQLALAVVECRTAALRLIVCYREPALACGQGLRAPPIP